MVSGVSGFVNCLSVGGSGAGVLLANHGQVTRRVPANVFMLA